MGWGGIGWGSIAWGATNGDGLDVLPPDPPLSINITPPFGPVTGGTSVVISGDGFDMSECSDLFHDASLDPMWSTIDSGSGSAVELIGSLRLNTGTTIGSISGIRTAETVDDIDVKIRVNSLNDFIVRPKDKVITTKFGLFIDSGNYVYVQINRGISRGSVSAIAVDGGITVVDFTSSSVNFSKNLRLLRINNRVIILLGNIIFADFVWTNKLANVEISVDNLNENIDVQTEILHYIRNPLVLFFNEPMLDQIVVGDTRIRGTTPESLGRLPGIVGVKVKGCNELDFGAFEYRLPDNLLVVTDSLNGNVRLISDYTIRNAINGQFGQKIGS